MLPGILSRSNGASGMCLILRALIKFLIEVKLIRGRPVATEGGHTGAGPPQTFVVPPQITATYIHTALMDCEEVQCVNTFLYVLNNIYNLLLLLLMSFDVKLVTGAHGTRPFKSVLPPINLACILSVLQNCILKLTGRDP